jgi:hypothetical protein
MSLDLLALTGVEGYMHSLWVEAAWNLYGRNTAFRASEAGEVWL